MQIFDAITDEPLTKSLELAFATNDAWQPMAQHLTDLLSFLNSAAPDLRLYAVVLSQNPPVLLFTGPNKCAIKIASDYYDQSQTSKPQQLHIRMEIRRHQDKPRDIRTYDFDEVARQIRLAFGLHDR